MGQEKKAIWGWVLYDWANSAFATSVMAGFFPVFFKIYWNRGADANRSTALLGFGNSTASLLVALMAPVLGAIADKGSARKKFMILFAYLGVLMTGTLFLVGEGAWALAIGVYAMGCIGFSGANIFYDALLPSVASVENIDYVSGLGYGVGYLGGGLLFLLNICMIDMPQRFGMPDADTAVRYVFLSVALWWGAFTAFTVLWVPEEKGSGRVSALWWVAIGEGAKQLIDTFRKMKRLKPVFTFLLAYWFYIDGVDTIVRMAVDYGLSLGFESNDLIKALLIVQFVGFPAALAFGKLGQQWNVRKAIFLAIGFYVFIIFWGVLMTQKEEFYVLAVLIGLVQGGIQALSRSYYSRLIPKQQWAEFFGLYNMLGKFAAIMGPALIGVVGIIVRKFLMPPAATSEQIEAVAHMASRWGLASILLLFIVGGVLLYFVEGEKGKSAMNGA